MSQSRLPFTGRLETAGFVIDPSMIGPAQARQRVAAWWAEGSRLLQLDDRWVLLLPEPISVRAEHAPGLPLQATAAGFCVPDRGTAREINPDHLERIDLSDIVDQTGLAVSVLAPAPTLPEPVAHIDRPPTRAVPELRRSAGVGAADTRLARKGARLAREAARGAAPPSSHGYAARILAKTPAMPILRRRHQRYVEDLSASFRKGDWDEALRSAISLGSGSGAFTMRLPTRPGPVLGPRNAPSAESRSVPYGASVHQHLRSLYLTAAAQLEQQGRYLQAAFVHADLLNQPVAAVELLERHREFGRAAELAEGWRLDPGLVVRLWWRAGDRHRAVQVASLRGAFADAIARLEKADEPAAKSLRLAWMQERRAAGDHLGAVTAAWPISSLRAEALPDIAAGIAQGGHLAGTLLPYLLEQAPTPDAAQLARALLTDEQAPHRARAAFVRSLALHTAGEPTIDRELTSLSLLTLLKGRALPPARSLHDVSRQLQQRADPLLVADLPRISPATTPPDAVLTLDATQPGQAQIHDAVAVGDNTILVALGELGVRLLTHDGRTRAHWNVPTHRLILADHGGRVLLATNRTSRVFIHQLELPNGRATELPALDAWILDTYDGTHPVLVSDRGIEWVEQHQGRWRLAWRELTEPHQRIHQVERRHDQMTAQFTDHSLNVWHWQLPQITLRERGTIEPAQQTAVLATGQIGRLHQESGVVALDWHSPYGHRLTTTTLYPHGNCGLLTSGSAYALVDKSPHAVSLRAHSSYDSPELAALTLPAESTPLFRSWGDWLVLGHSDGHIMVVDTERRELLSDTRLTV